MSLAYLHDRPHAIYVMWADDVAVYVGMSCHWEARLMEHGVWWPAQKADPAIRKWTLQDGDSAEVTHVDVWEVALNRTDARVLERQVIHELLPTHNRDNNPARVASKRAS